MSATVTGGGLSEADPLLVDALVPLLGRDSAKKAAAHICSSEWLATRILAARADATQQAAVVGVGVCMFGTCKQPALALLRGGWAVCGEHGVAEIDALADAIIDLCWRATPYGETGDGDIAYYLLTKGTVHRLIGAAQGARIPATFRNGAAPAREADPLVHISDWTDGDTRPLCVHEYAGHEGPCVAGDTFEHCREADPQPEGDRFYLGVGIDQRRCAACAASPTLPCAAHRDHEPCTGAGDCPARLHEHGCYADRDGTACNDPDDHDPQPDAGVQERHECVTSPLCHGWPFGEDHAYRAIAALAWPAERVENRDGWAVTMRHRPDLFEQTVAEARERFEAAISHARAAVTSTAADESSTHRQGGEG